MSREFFKVEINYGMINPLFCHGINDLQNQVPLGNFWARGAKWGCMTKNHCHVNNGHKVMRVFSNLLRNTKWICYSSYTSL